MASECQKMRSDELANTRPYARPVTVRFSSGFPNPTLPWRLSRTSFLESRSPHGTGEGKLKERE
jgi:hypothetical protein